MAFTIAKGANAEVKIIDSGAGERDLTDNWVSGGPTLNVNSVDVTSVSDSGMKRKLGLQDHSFSMTFLYDSAANKSWAVFKDRWAEDTVRNILFYPEKDTSGKPQITIPVLVTQLSLPMTVGDKLVIEVSFESDGTVTIDTV